MSKYTAVDMRWHKEKRINVDGVLRHPADAEGWKDFDKKNILGLLKTLEMLDWDLSLMGSILLEI